MTASDFHFSLAHTIGSINDWIWEESQKTRTSRGNRTLVSIFDEFEFTISSFIYSELISN